MMRLYEYRQSATSPLKYHLELRPEELEMTKELVMEIIKKIEAREDNESSQEEAWTEVHEDIVRWMTESTKFPARSDCG
jgi:hypothetical protein